MNLKALASALTSGHLAGAAAAVEVCEPLSADVLAAPRPLLTASA